MDRVTFRLMGKDHGARVTGCQRVTDDKDYRLPYYLWQIAFDVPIKLYDGSTLYQTYLRRFKPAAGFQGATIYAN